LDGNESSDVPSYGLVFASCNENSSWILEAMETLPWVRFLLADEQDEWTFSVLHNNSPISVRMIAQFSMGDLRYCLRQIGMNLRQESIRGDLIRATLRNDFSFVVKGCRYRIIWWMGFSRHRSRMLSRFGASSPAQRNHGQAT
jgi:hypothetical protein